MVNTRQTETRGERDEKEERERETGDRREKEATAGTHPTFDLFK